MSHKIVKVGLTALVLATAFGALLYSTMSENMQFYKYVDEVAAEPHAWAGKTLQVHGYVVPGSIGRKRDALEYEFKLQRNGHVITAYYTGTVPDTFKDEAEVVLTGELTPEGFMATGMTAKCPSKYEEAAPEIAKAQ